MRPTQRRCFNYFPFGRAPTIPPPRAPMIIAVFRRVTSTYVSGLSQLFISLDYYPDFIDGLIKQSMAWCDDYNLPIVVPLSCWLPDPRKTLVMSLSMTSHVTCFCTTGCGQYVFCGTSQGDVQMYQVSSKQRIITLGGKSSDIMCP